MSVESHSVSDPTTRRFELLLAVANVLVACWVAWSLYSVAGSTPSRMSQAPLAWVATGYSLEILGIGLLVLVTIVTPDEEGAFLKLI